MRFTLAALIILVSTASSAQVVQPLCGDDGSHRSDGKQAPAVFTEAQKIGTKATCPVSGEQFTIDASTVHAEHQGKHVYFCCPGCKPKFDKNPDKYLARNS